ncbi:MAG: hypothetical protein KGL50_15855, partial [Burkholderiales bacterium]|nr:hypothetical protein [Burkholderiales bacterium]
WVPQRFHVTQQRAWGDRHLYALRSRFIPDALLPLFDCAQPAPGRGSAEPGAAGADGPGLLLDLAAVLRGPA